MIIDLNRSPRAPAQYQKVLLDGREINGAWYVNTVAGVVKTYDIFSDCQFPTKAGPIAARFISESYPQIVLDLETIDGNYSLTLHGKVELR